LIEFVDFFGAFERFGYEAWRFAWTRLPGRGLRVMPLMLVTMKVFDEYSDEFGMMILGMRSHRFRLVLRSSRGGKPSDIEALLDG
jgi:hypothetical protein